MFCNKKCIVLPGTLMAAAWYLRKSSLPLSVRLPMLTPKFEPRGYPPTNASGNTTNWDPNEAASANNLSALSDPRLNIRLFPYQKNRLVETSCMKLLFPFLLINQELEIATPEYIIKLEATILLSHMK